MPLIVQKYGGSSVYDTDMIVRVAERIAATRKTGHDVVAVISAMGNTTDTLLDLANRVNPLPPPREVDMLLTAGERISNALVAMAIQTFGPPACSLSGAQAGVITTSTHGNAQILRVTPHRVRTVLGQGAVAVVAGFQGLSQDTGETTTLGRGGSDTTAVALAAALDAELCEIYTDVDGIYTADPKLVPTAHPLDHVTYEAIELMAASGARVLALSSVQYARRHGMPLHVRSSYTNKPGTLVTRTGQQPTIIAIAHDRSVAKLTVSEVPDRSGLEADLQRAIADQIGDTGMLIQAAPSASRGRIDLTIVLPKDNGPTAVAAVRRQLTTIGSGKLLYDESLSKISVVGSNMPHLEVAATCRETLDREGIAISTITASPSHIAALCHADHLDNAVRTLHDALNLAKAEGLPEPSKFSEGVSD